MSARRLTNLDRGRSCSFRLSASPSRSKRPTWRTRALLSATSSSSQREPASSPRRMTAWGPRPAAWQLPLGRAASARRWRSPGSTRSSCGRPGRSTPRGRSSAPRWWPTAPGRPRSSVLLEAREVVDVEAVGLAVRLVALERGLRVLAGDDGAGVVEEEQLAGGDRDRLHLLVADDDGLVRGGGGLVDDVAGPRDPVVLEVAPRAADRVDDHGARVVVGRHVGAGRHAEAGDDLAPDRVDLVVLEQDLVG